MWIWGWCLEVSLISNSMWRKNSTNITRFGPTFVFPHFFLTLSIPSFTEISSASDIGDLYEWALKQWFHWIFMQNIYKLCILDLPNVLVLLTGPSTSTITMYRASNLPCTNGDCWYLVTWLRFWLLDMKQILLLLIIGK